MTDYKIPVVTKEMALRNAISGYVVTFKEKGNDYYEAKKSINKIVEEIITFLRKDEEIK